MASEKANLVMLGSVKSHTPCSKFLLFMFFFQGMQSDTNSENTVITDDEESVTNIPQVEKCNKV